MRRYSLFCIVLLLALIATSCDDETLVGKDLIDDGDLLLAVKDDFPITGKSVLEGPIVTFENNIDRKTYVLGSVNDPIFGSVQSDVYLGLSLISSPNYSNAVVDSIVLILSYDTLGTYGVYNSDFTLDVHRVREDFLSSDKIQSDQSFMVDAMPIGSKTFLPAPKDSVRVLDRLEEDSIVTLRPQIRIPLDNALAEEIFANPLASESDTSLVNLINGLYIKTTSSSDAMVGIDFSDASTSSVKLYFTVNDTTKRLQTYPIKRAVYAEIENDASNAVLNSFLDDEAKGDSLLFQQGMGGADTELAIGDLSSLQNKLINKAELTLTVSTLPGDFPRTDYPDIQRLLAYTYNDSGEKVFIDDLEKLRGNTAESFGGAVEKTTRDGVEVREYKLNLTDYIQRLVYEKLDTARISLSSELNVQSPRNTVFYGPKSSTYPVTLKVTYTEL